MTAVRFGLAVDSDNGHHVRFRLFSATGGEHLGGCGAPLVMRPAEYAAFRQLLEPMLTDRPTHTRREPDVANAAEIVAIMRHAAARLEEEDAQAIVPDGVGAFSWGSDARTELSCQLCPDSPTYWRGAPVTVPAGAVQEAALRVRADTTPRVSG